MAKLVTLVLPYGQEFMQGIARYIHTHQEWDCSVVPDLQTAAGIAPGDLGSGVIVQLFSEAFAGFLKAGGVPTVNVSSFKPDWGFPSVLEDNQAIGKMAAGYFIDHGYQHFAFVGETEPMYAGLRWQSFSAELLQRGFEAPAKYEKNVPVSSSDVDEFKLWVDDLPRPLAILAVNDTVARQVVRGLLARGEMVPEEVAVLGVDNDRATCELISTPISSIDRNAELIGFEAARLLDRVMAGETPPRGATLVPPSGVVERQTTQALAVEDATVREALRLMRDRQADVTLAVQDVASELGITLRSLQRRFRTYVGHSPRQELIRLRLVKTRALLRDTAMGLDDIAAACGFADATYLCRSFKKAENLTPIEYRKQQQLV